MVELGFFPHDHTPQRPSQQWLINNDWMIPASKFKKKISHEDDCRTQNISYTSYNNSSKYMENAEHEKCLQTWEFTILFSKRHPHSSEISSPPRRHFRPQVGSFQMQISALEIIGM